MQTETLAMRASHPVAASPLLSIAAVERDTGLSKDTLRVWERRYGFPSPHRDAMHERAYPLEQVEKLRVVKRLLDAGYRPGRTVALPLEQLLRLGAGAVAELRLDLPLIRQRDANFIRLADHMVVGDDHAVGLDNDA